MVLVLLTLGVLLGGLSIYRHLGTPHPELLRKLLHVGMGLMTLAPGASAGFKTTYKITPLF